jgi:hypothetical protein
MSLKKNYLIKKVKVFLNNLQFEKYTEKNSIFYPACYLNFIGSYTLSKILNVRSKKIKNIYIILKDILYSLKYLNPQIFQKKKLPFYNKIFFTWALDGDFENDGSFKDRYLNINSKNLKNTLWFVIFLGKKKPEIVNENIVIIFFKKGFSINLLFFLNFFLNRLKLLFYNNLYFLNSISNHNFFADIFLKEVKQFLKKDLKLVYMPFEGQPFQNKLIFYLKNNFKNIEILGYIHSPPLSFPTNFIFRKNTCPNKLIVNGDDQFYCFNKHLGWKKSSLKQMKSFRFLKDQKKNFTNTIFLPLEIKSPEKVMNSFKTLIKKKKFSINNFLIRNHPVSNTFSNKKLINYIKILKEDKKFNNKKKINYSIFIGNSGSIIEALERGSKALHICEDEIFDVYSSLLYPNLTIKKISENIYEYRIKKRGHLINFGSKNNNLSIILNLIKDKNIL